MPSFRLNVPRTKSDLDKGIIRYNNIGKSQQDKRQYRGLKLDNGLKALLVSDPLTDKSGAALTVNVGHLTDPDNLVGLAHFCEHMLFLGTEKYPNENEYSSYLAENGGSSNASTFGDNTEYYFDIVSNKLDGALDRFAQFFIAPLFTESATDREINAVDSEHEKNLSADIWRIKQVFKSSVDPSHPYSRFGTGNKKTLFDDPKLRNVNIREELIKFHNKWYSSNIMCLAVYGKESLDELEGMVIPKFSQITNKNVEQPKWERNPLLPEHLATKTYIVPVKDSRTLTITFPCGDLEKHYRSAPEQYLSHLIGHEGAGSILSELKNRNWCNSLMAGHNSPARGFGFFDIMVDLTTEGFDNVNEIIKIIFQYLKLIKSEDPKKWIYEEYCNLSDMQFRFMEKETAIVFVSNVVQSLQLYPFEEVLTAPYLISEWRPDLISDLVNIFTPNCCKITIVGKKYDDICTSKEVWYGTKYHIEKIGLATLTEWDNSTQNDNLTFPAPNPFIPTDFEILPIDTDSHKFPTIIQDNPIIRVWFKQDTDFHQPKALLNFDFSSPLAYADPLNCNLTHMFVQLFKDQLNEHLYEAKLAGLRLSVSNTSNGINLLINGYSHKQKVLLVRVFDQLFSFEFDVQRFDIIKEQLTRALHNFKADQPYQHAVFYLALILTEHSWTKQELIDAIPLITESRLKQFINDFLSRMHVECFIYGNVNKSKALELASLAESKLRNTNASILPLLSRQLLLKREYKLKTGEHYLFETQNEFHKSSCAELYLQCGEQTDTANVYIDLIGQLLNEPCYNTLRTKEQLGYIVFSGTRKSNGVQGIRFIVQSTRHPAFVESRIESFLTSILVEYLHTMTEEEFDRHKDALASQKLEKPKRLIEQFIKFSNEISNQQYHFDRSEVEVTILKNITKQQVIEYYNNYILMGAPKRHALSIHIVSTVLGGAGDVNSIKCEEQTQIVKKRTVNEKCVVLISDLAVFKSSKELYPVVQPYINIQPKGARSKL